MEKHFVKFLSPGTFVNEERDVEIPFWDVGTAAQMAHDITERHGATPYGFIFFTRSRKEDELDSKVTAQSPVYYLGGEIQTYDQVMERNDPKEETLRFNMKSNGYDRIIVNKNSWTFTAGLNEKDVVLDWTPRPKPEPQT